MTMSSSSPTASSGHTQYRWNSTGKTVAGVGVIAGTSPNLLTYPCGIVLDASNTLYIADSGSHRNSILYKSVVLSLRRTDVTLDGIKMIW